ncbi:MAG: ribonuclease P protein component [Candidatus Methylomirabilia bacterium]
MSKRLVTGGLPRSERLRRPGEFRAVFQDRRRTERPSLVVLWRLNDDPRRIGFAVSRQVRGAVRRNRARRRLREAYRRSRQALPSRVQLVCVAREPAVREPFGVLLREMRSAFRAVGRCEKGAHEP